MAVVAVNLREIGPGQWKRHRWDWLRSVRRADAGTLNMTAKLVAHALVHEFANHESGECAPSPKKLAQEVGVHTDTVKRALDDLVAYGFIERRAPNRVGRGHASSIVFLARAEIVPIKRGTVAPISSARKGGNPAPVSDGSPESERGAILREKGGNPAPPPTPPYIDKPKKNQNAGARDGLSRFSALAVQTAQSYGPKIGRGERVHPCIFSEESIACILALDLATADQIVAAGLGDLLPKKGQGNDQ